MNRVNLTGIYSYVHKDKKLKNVIENVAANVTINNGCCMGLKLDLETCKLYYIYPVDWLPEEYRTKDKTDKIKDFILAVTVYGEFCGYYDLDDHFVDLVNINSLFNVQSKLDLNITADTIVKDKTFMVFESKMGSTKMETYYDFCIIRATFSKYYQHIILKALEIYEDGIDPFTALQLGHYHDLFRPEADKFLFKYPAKILTFDDFKVSLKNKNQSLNSKFKLVEVSIEKCQNYIKLKKYKELLHDLK